MTTEADRAATKHAYNAAAQVYAKKYDAIAPRVAEIELVWSFVTKPDPYVLEIGFGSGREARYLLTKTSHYIGIDISETMRSLAQAQVATGTFVCADVTTYQFTSPLDVVFAFASLLHSDQADLRAIFSNIASAMEPGGLVFLSLKRHDTYGCGVVDDGESVRTFYYYTKQVVLACADGQFELVHYDEQHLKEPWFTILLRRIDPFVTITG